jgi:hypothetical protein
MSESNNVKFAEDNGKWLWKRYDAEGSVIYRSPLFDTEREAREDYEQNGGNPASPAPESAPADTSVETAPEQTAEGSAEGTAESTAESAIGESEQQTGDDNNAGSAVY